MNIWMSWSSGKDSAYALYQLKQQNQNVTALFTTINSEASRVAMHAVREELLEKQAEAMSLPLHKIYIPYPCSNERYEEEMSKFVSRAKNEGVTHFAFGDLFLEDIKQYRIDKLEGSGIAALFPLWGLPTRPLAEEMIRLNQKAYITCVDPKKLNPSFAGREYDLVLLNDLSSEVDPCGENGEFHTFVYDSPLFKSPLRVKAGKTEVRDGFVFTDVYMHRYL